MDEDLSKWQQMYLNNPLIQRVVELWGEFLTLSDDELATSTGDWLRDTLAKTYLDSHAIESGAFPTENAYQFCFYIPDLQCVMIVRVIAACGKDAMKQGLSVGAIFGGQLCSVQVPANA